MQGHPGKNNNRYIVVRMRTDRTTKPRHEPRHDFRNPGTNSGTNYSTNSGTNHSTSSGTNLAMEEGNKSNVRLEDTKRRLQIGRLAYLHR